jgi:sugar phosphate isomerase/epimerase
VRVALSSFSVPWAIGIPGHEPAAPLDALGLIRLAADHGVSCVQFADNLPLHTLGVSELDAVARAAADSGVAIELGTRGIGPWLDDYARLAARFDATFVRLVVDLGADEPTPEEAVERLRPFERGFRERGLRLAIENHDRFSTGELLGILDGLGDWVGICLDTVNSLGCLETPRDVVRALGSRTINLHLKDFTIRRHSHQLGFEVVGAPAGDGMLDIPWLLESLDHSEVETAVLELWTPMSDSIERTVALEAEWVEQSLANLDSIPGLMTATSSSPARTTGSRATRQR